MPPVMLALELRLLVFHWEGLAVDVGVTALTFSFSIGEGAALLIIQDA